MKKIVVLLAIATLLAAPAFGGIRNSKHDLSDSGNQTVSSDNLDELCVFCHTPHGGVNDYPLWNRSLGNISLDATANELYNSTTLTSFSQPTQVETAVNASDAPLCLSCHDGNTLATGLINPPNVLKGDPITFVGTTTVTGFMNLNDPTGNWLRNDHPIGMDYSSAQGADNGGLKGSTIAAGVETVDSAGGTKLPLYDTTGVMWCSSCHDVHDNQHTPFLNMSNGGSAMCLTCHDK